MILKFLAEDAPELLVAGVFLVAAPCWGADEDWSAEEYLVSERSAAELSQRLPIFLYHSREDPIVPFSHLEAYAARLPEATIRVLDGSDHAFANGLPELVDDVSCQLSTVSGQHSGGGRPRGFPVSLWPLTTKDHLPTTDCWPLTADR